MAQWSDPLDRRTALFSLRDLRFSKGISQAQLAAALKISKSMYHAVEHGQRKPSIDTAYQMAVIYGCSMDFIYHAFYRQHYIWYYPEAELEYSMREAKSMDIQYLKSKQPPAAPPEIPAVIIWETDTSPSGLDNEATKPYDDFKPYGLNRGNLL